MKKRIPIVGMACASCAAHVEEKLRSIPGVSEAKVSLLTRTAEVEFELSQVSLEKIKKEINSIGFDVVIDDGVSSYEIEKKVSSVLKKKVLLSWMFSILAMIVSMGMIHIRIEEWRNYLLLILSALNIIVCGRDFYIRALKFLRHGIANMDVLVSLSTFVVFVFSCFNTFWGDLWLNYGYGSFTYFDASIMIITFVLTGKLLEEKAKDKTTESIKKLMGLVPETAHLLKNHEIYEVPLSTIEVGDSLVVYAGEKIPVDGKVIAATSFMEENASFLDESMMSGEAVPIKKVQGSNVFAGSILKQGEIHFKAVHVGRETVLSRMIEKVREAQTSKAPIQRVVDKIAKVFVPVVALISLLTFLCWWILGGNDNLPHAIISAVSVMVIACPCALGLATPTAIMIGIGKAAEKNILVKDATALEALEKIDAIILDKTGTLTIPNKNIDFTRTDSLKVEERETLKRNAQNVVSELQKQDIDVYMMSGDNSKAVEYWATILGIQHYESEVGADRKEKLVRDLQGKGHHVAMVGDGINDVQALALSNVGIAMGKGTDIAMDVAQITLMKDDLEGINEAIILSRQTIHMIRQNLLLAFIYNVLSIPLAAGFFNLFGLNFQITPIWASALMAFSSISVILNSLRLRYMR